MNIICFNGTFSDQGEVHLNPVNRGMMYGDGCFDTIRSYKGKFLFHEIHYQRLTEGLSFLGMDVPFSEKEYVSVLRELVGKNNATEKDCVVRTQCWREGTRGYHTQESKSSWMITLSEIKCSEEPVNLVTVSVPAISSKALPRSFKFSNSLNYILSAKEAREKGADDALMLTESGSISETTIANVFWIKEKVIFTPSVECDLLPGVTRNAVISCIRHSEELKLKVGEFQLSDMMDADAVFGTNSIREIFPVATIDKMEFDHHNPVVQSLKNDFQKLKEKHFI
jgi:branched-subunit amino acid aminotransferase/4-amino-4-deoxychorismate lyase